MAPSKGCLPEPKKGSKWYWWPLQGSARLVASLSTPFSTPALPRVLCSPQSPLRYSSSSPKKVDAENRTLLVCAQPHARETAWNGTRTRAVLRGLSLNVCGGLTRATDLLSDGPLGSNVRNGLGHDLPQWGPLSRL